MTRFQLDAEITSFGRLVDLGAVAADADCNAWCEAREVLRERACGNVVIAAQWPEFRDAPAIRIPLQIDGAADRDVASYLELFFHDVFLLLNLAAPGSFGGAIAFATHELTLDARVFEYAWAHGRTSIAPLPLARVAAWYDGRGIDTKQLAITDDAKALFHLLHLARAAEDETIAIVRLAAALDVLGVRDGDAELQRLFALRDAIAHGTAPVVHPMHDEGLDASIENVSIDAIDAADHAASVVIAELQRRIRTSSV